MRGVKYLGTPLSPVGYGSAARAFITALYCVGVDVTTEIIYQMPDRTNYGFQGELAKQLENRDIPYNIKIIHLTPDTAVPYMEKDKYNILHLFWETDRLPKEWIEPCNKAREIWTSSGSMAHLMRESGVKVPIYDFPQPIDISVADKDWGKFDVKGEFIFYAIFQWITRKNPKALLMSYWKAFNGRKDVTLLLKTFRINYSEDEQAKIMSDIASWKRESGLTNFPRILFAPELLDNEGILKLHNTGDCYLSADRGEGWSRPLHEALLMGKPCITTARGGIHEYLNKDYYFPIQSKYVPVVEEPWIAYYKSDQQWADLDTDEFMERMKWVFANRELAGIKGLKAKNFIKDQFSYHKIGLAMRERLENIDKSL